MKFSLKLVGLDRLAQRITKALPEEVKKRIWDGIKREARIVYQIGQHNAPVKTGALRSRVEIRFQPSRLSARVGVFADPVGDRRKYRAHVARFLEFGVKPHATRRGADVSRNKKQLGKQHPGIPARHWFLGATLPGRTNLSQKLHGDFVEALRKVQADLPLPPGAKG
ncbi:MAG TPA: hypothetical protein VHB73_01515 [Alphaproteobacteria bacterium]|nr:hypothetical protein [Alphaproteobacteria bacterium]